MKAKARGWFSLAAACAMLASCGPEPVQPSLNDLPNREARNPQWDAIEEQNQMDASFRIQLTRRTWTFDLDARMDAVWAFIDEGQVPATLRATLNRNGIRVGTINAARWQPMLSVLPPTLSQGEEQVVSVGRLMPAAEGVDLQGRGLPVWLEPRPTREQLDEGFVPRGPEVIQRGRPRVLMLALPDRVGGGFQVSVVPQNHQRPSTPVVLDQTVDPPAFRQMTMAEIDRYGRIFDELSAELYVAPGQILIIGLARTFPPIELPENGDPRVSWPLAWRALCSVGALPFEQVYRPGPRRLFPDLSAPPLIPSLGTAILANTRSGSRVQQFIILQRTP